MKILHISNTDIRYDSRILKELDVLTNIDTYDVYAIGVKNTWEKASCSEIPINAKIYNINCLFNNFRRMPRTIRYTLYIIELSIKIFLRAIKNKPKIIHCHDTMVLPAGVLIKIFTKSKLIYDAHELESNKNGQTAILSKATLYIERKCWHYIDHFISVSPSIITWYENKLGAKSNSLILNSPYIKENFSITEKYFHRLYDIPHDKLIFIYLGAFGYGRGINIILSAFSNEKINSHVVFIGYGFLENKIKEASEKYSHIHLHKPIPHEEIVPLVKNANIGLCLIENVSLSDYYSLPNKLFEYSFARLPVLASNFPNISKIVNQYKLGKCCEVNTDSVINTIIEFEKSPPSPVIADLTELGWEKQAEKLTNLYQTLLE